MNDLELYHHGIKGMKWGVRKKRDYLARDRARAQKKLDNAKTERGRAKAQKTVSRLAKADTKVYNTRIRNQRKNAAVYTLAVVGTMAAKTALSSIGPKRMNELLHTHLR